MMRNKNKLRLFKHQILFTGIAVFALVVSVFGSSYAIFTSSVSSGDYNVLQVGELEISYVDPGSGYGDILSLNGAYPVADKDGKESEPYRFYIKNVGGVAVDFKVKLKNDESIIMTDNCGDNLLSNDYVRVQFDSTGTVYTLSDLISSDYTLYEKQNLASGSSEIHEIRIWIAANAPNSVLGSHFHGKVVVELTQAGIDSRYTKAYSIGDSVRLVDGSRWHVLSPADNNGTMVTLLSDYTLNSGIAFDTVTTDSSTNTTTPNRDSTLNTYCTDLEHGCNMYEKNNSTVVADSSLKTWLETTYKPVLENSLTTANGTLEDLVVSIPSMDQIAKADYKTFDQSVVQITNSNFLTTSSYWTRTHYSGNTSSVWYISQTTNQSDLIYANNNTIGVRPVITVSKLNVVTE